MNDGRDLRLNILRRDAEAKILGPLRTHGWRAAIEQEGYDFLIIQAERGDQRRHAALLYSSATDNKVYRALAERVDCIFFNGEVAGGGNYAYGVSKPVGPVSDFQLTLIEWNRASSNSDFAPEGNEPEAVIEASPPPYRFMLSEQPLESIWLRVQQFQSVRVAEKLVQRRAAAEGIALSPDAVQSKAEGVAFSLRNALDYFQASTGRNVSQRALNLYYGSIAFVFAEMLSSPRGPHALTEIENQTKQGHGLYTLDGISDALGDLVVGVISQGFFASWMSFLGHPTKALPSKRPRETADLANATYHTVEELFASIPEVSDLFRDTLDGKPRWVRPVYDQEANRLITFGPSKQPDRTYLLFVDDSARLDKEDMTKFPVRIQEIRQVASEKAGRVFRGGIDHPGIPVHWNAMPLHSSPFEQVALIQPIFGTVGEYRAICVALLYGLSIIVRYRPSIWRRVQHGDLDHFRVLVEGYLAVVERILPEQFLEQVLGQRVFAKLTGSLY